MSNSTDIYDKIRATLPTLTGFSAKTEIPYPYSLEDNNESFLREGWGVKIGPSVPDTKTDFPEYPVISSFEVVLTERVIFTGSNADPVITVTKKMMADISVVVNDFTSTRFTTADKIEYVGIATISGAENVTSGKFNHISMAITFDITHWK